VLQLDEPVLEYLLSLIRESSKAISSPQGLFDAIGDLLVSYDAASGEEDAKQMCKKLYPALVENKVITTTGASVPQTERKEATTSKDKETTTAKLAIPVRIEDTIPESERPKPKPTIQPKTTQQLYEEIVQEEEEKVYNDSDTRRAENQVVCDMCEREMPLTFHHLMPKTTHAKYRARGFSQTTLNKGVWICRPCHNAIHRLIDEDTLAESFNTLELLMEDERVLKWAKYCSKQRVNRSKADGHAQKLRYAK